jgi:hypothetical protein
MVIGDPKNVYKDQSPATDSSNGLPQKQIPGVLSQK